MFTTSLGEHKARGINKILLASFYLILAVILFIQNREFNTFHVIILIAILGTYIGDIVLMYHFNLGALFFTIGNLSLFAYDFCLLESLGVHFSQYWWFILVYVGLIAGYFILEHFSTHFKIEKKDRLKAFAYLAMVTLHGSIGTTMYFVTDNKSAILLGFGSILFMLSDYVLCSYKYSFNKESSVHKLNTFLYFAGILLITWSIYVF